MALTKITSRILDSSGVTTVGTISTGVWQGTAINQTYLVGQSGTNTGDETLARINALDITELGTISSGVWNGTAINQTYLVGQSGTNTGDETLARINALDITELGTVSSGVWQGSVIASTYLDADTAHLNAVQTFTGAKTFSGNVRIGTGTNHALFAADGVYVQGSQNGYLVSPADWRFYSGGTLKMTLQSGGNLGIGTTSPNAKLKVEGNAATNGLSIKSAGNGGTYPFMVTWSGGSEGDAFCVNDSLNVGIGTTSPSGKLHIASSGGADGLRLNAGTSSSNFAIIANNQADNATLFYVKGDGSALFGGKVGIGTTSPAELLEVKASSSPAIQINQNDQYKGIIRLGGNDLEIRGSSGALEFYNGSADGDSSTLRMSISSGGEYSFGTPSGVTYGHGSNDGFHLRTGLELGFGNGNNNRPDFGINATGSGGGASLNIYCGEGSDDIDIQVSPGAVMQFNSGGIKFGSSGETLSSYEEGTFSPNLQKNDSSGSGQLSSGSQTRVGRYVRVGKQCAIWIYVYMTAANAPATTHNTSWLVQGLPFTFRGSTPYQFLPCGYAMISGTQVNQHVRLQINNSADSGIIYARHHIDSNNNNGGVIEFTFAGVLEIN